MLTAGFGNPVLSAQSTFRAILDAMARPGSLQPIGEAVEAPGPMSAGAAALALTLCDHDAPVWLDDGLRQHEAVSEWLRFHCGCPIASSKAEAAFAFISDPDALPSFDEFNLGTVDYPDRSTTVVMQVASFDVGPTLALAGPGIKARTAFRASPLPADMPERLAVNRRLFPRGVDLILVTANTVAALPRSIRLMERMECT